MIGQRPIKEDYVKGDQWIAPDANAIAEIYNRTDATGGLSITSKADGGWLFEGPENYYWEGQHALGMYEIDPENKKVKFNKGWLFHLKWYEIPAREVQITGGTVDIPQYAVVEYIHRASATIMPVGQTHFNSSAGISRIPLKTFYLDDGERLAEPERGGTLHYGNIIFGGPVMP